MDGHWFNCILVKPMMIVGFGTWEVVERASGVADVDGAAG